MFFERQRSLLEGGGLKMGADVSKRSLGGGAGVGHSGPSQAEKSLNWLKTNAERAFKQFDEDQGRMRSLFKCTVDDAPIACWVHYCPEITRYRAPSPRYVTALLAAASLAGVSDQHIININAAAHQLWLGHRHLKLVQQLDVPSQPSLN